MPAILSLDLGTNTGFALRRGDTRVESGTVRFNARKDEPPGARFNRFRRWLVDVKQANPDLARVAYEEVVAISIPGRQGGLYAAQVYGGFLAIVLMFCDHHQIEAEGFHISTVKKLFAGSGRAQKIDVIAQCKALGFNPGTDNEADAIAVLHVATGTCPVLTMNGATPKKRTPKPQPTLAAGDVPF